jgi:TolB protein
MVDTLSGESIEMMSSESYVYGAPKFSPDGTRIAFTITNGAPDVWVADVNVSGHERRVVSGSVLDWTPDGNTLVVDRDNELQLVSVSDGTARSVTRRSGKYPDPDFHGVDYVGIILKR